MASNPPDWTNAYSRVELCQGVTVAHSGQLDQQQVETAASLAKANRLRYCKVDGTEVFTPRGKRLGDTVHDSALAKAVRVASDGGRAHCPYCRSYLRAGGERVGHPGPECPGWAIGVQWLRRHKGAYSVLYGHKDNPSLVLSQGKETQ